MPLFGIVDVQTRYLFLQQATEKHINLSNEVYCMLVDLQKEYDKVNRSEI